MQDRLQRCIRRTLIILTIGIPAGGVVLWFGMQISSRPHFCGSCHYMKPYYNSWRTSTHNHIACVECHIPPGITSELRKKYEAIAMVARYFTGTYSTKPWAEVDDRSCLRSGCHEKRLLLSREVFHHVWFDHRPHLVEMRWQKQLRCTSCHAQIVQGRHISVTTSTCFLCHFKDTQLNHGTARCTLCHPVPEKLITTAGLSFDHGEVKRFDMDCTFCHQEVVKGNGEVPRERCYTCHNDPQRLHRYGETALLHRTHVTEHQVECLNCHIEIVHKIPAREAVPSPGCPSCHSAAAGHSAMRALYRGIGGKGVKPRPAVMYLVGVRCEACHNLLQGERHQANEVSCMACHGPRYLVMYRNWQIGLAQRTAGVQAELRMLRASVQTKGGAIGQALLAEAEANLSLVEQGKGIHNPPYALDLLKKAHQDLVAVFKAIGMEAPSSPPWAEAPYGAKCLACHFGIEYLSGTVYGQQFPHMAHTVMARLRCTLCHGDLAQHGILKLTADTCRHCHEKISRPTADMASEACLECHSPEVKPLSDQIKFSHAKHIASGLDCTLCHSGVEDMPHRAYARSPDALPRPEHAFCGGCHAEDVPTEEGPSSEEANCWQCHVDS